MSSLHDDFWNNRENWSDVFVGQWFCKSVFETKALIQFVNNFNEAVPQTVRSALDE
jgi:hypothetical protein